MRRSNSRHSVVAAAVAASSWNQQALALEPGLVGQAVAAGATALLCHGGGGEGERYARVEDRAPTGVGMRQPRQQTWEGLRAGARLVDVRALALAPLWRAPALCDARAGSPALGWRARDGRPGTADGLQQRGVVLLCTRSAPGGATRFKLAAAWRHIARARALQRQPHPSLQAARQCAAVLQQGGPA